MSTAKRRAQDGPELGPTSSKERVGPGATSSSGKAVDKEASPSHTIWVVNPNSSEAMTQLMRTQQPAIPWCQFKYLTTNGAPVSIDNFADEISSAQAAFKLVLQRLDWDERLQHEPGLQQEPLQHERLAIVVGCFSDHPLTQMLRERFAADAGSRAPPSVLNLLQGAVYSALANVDKFGVMTTLPSMVEDIENGVYKAIGTTSSTRFVGVDTIGFSAGEVNNAATHDTMDSEEVRKAIEQALERLDGRGAKTVILGCSALGHWYPYAERYGKRFKLRIIESFSAAVAQIVASQLTTSSFPSAHSPPKEV